MNESQVTQFKVEHLYDYQFLLNLSKIGVCKESDFNVKEYRLYYTDAFGNLYVFTVDWEEFNAHELHTKYEGLNCRYISHLINAKDKAIRDMPYPSVIELSQIIPYNERSDRANTLDIFYCDINLVICPNMSGNPEINIMKSEVESMLAKCIECEQFVFASKLLKLKNRLIAIN